MTDTTSDFHQGYRGRYSAVTDFIRAWREKAGKSPSKALVPLSFELGEAFQFDWSDEGMLVGGVFYKVQVSHLKLCSSRAFWLVAYPSQMDIVKPKRWRLPLAFIALAGIAGPGLAVNGIVKPLWERARPSQIQEFGGTQQFSRVGVFAEECSKDCSFVSGHAACGFFFSSLCLVFRKRWVAWIALGILAGAAIGFSRISSMNHWLSDVLWAFPVTLISSWVVWWVLRLFEPEY